MEKNPKKSTPYQQRLPLGDLKTSKTILKQINLKDVEYF